MKKTPSPYHFVGIGGIGMSALAHICLEKEHKVTGSDQSLSQHAEKLIHKGAKVQVGHSPSALPEGGIVVYSSSISEDNPEIQAAKKKHLPLWHRSDLLAKLMEGGKALAVAGTHGKTTVSALLTTVLQESNLSPTFALGGVLKGSGKNGGVGEGAYFVAEVDESDGSFLKYHPYGAILTNIDEEHLACYGSFNALLGAFSTFSQQVGSLPHFLYCADDPHLPALIRDRGTSYGFSDEADCQILNFEQKKWDISFDLCFEGKITKDVVLPMVGPYNAQNAAAVFALCVRLGIKEESILRAFHQFRGVARRLEHKGEVQSVRVLDDYAHHPTEITLTLEALREACPTKRIVALFQPHRPSRTFEQLENYKRAFQDKVDVLIITDIYLAGESPIEGFSAKTLVEKIPFQGEVHYIPRAKLAQGALEWLRPNDVVVTLGAGDINKTAEDLCELLEKKGPKKLVVGLIEGGRSSEHEISLRSAKRVKGHLDQRLYLQKHFLIDPEGRWHFGKEVGNPLSGPILEELMACDLLFPVLHGPYGEDGTLQGLFEILDKPYVGPDFRSAALCMDKALSKLVVEKEGVATLPFLAFDNAKWKKEKEPLKNEIERRLGYPVYVKPVHLGSSIAIHSAENAQELTLAIEQAFAVDNKVLVEKGCEGARELEFAVIGNGEAIEVPPPGEVFSSEILYDFEGKYGKNPSRKEVVATLHPTLLRKGQALAKRAYRALGCSGMTRVDFFLEEGGTFWFLEANPIPGMAEKSLFPRIWEKQFGNNTTLYDKLISLAFHRHAAMRALV